MVQQRRVVHHDQEKPKQSESEHVLMDNETRQFIGAVIGAAVGITLKFTVFAEQTGFYWWVLPILFGRLGMTLAKIDKK
jgi:hypothetical protein